MIVIGVSFVGRDHTRRGLNHVLTKILNLKTFQNNFPKSKTWNAEAMWLEIISIYFIQEYT